MRKHFVIWTKDNCGFCIRAKQLVTQKGHSYEEKKVAPTEHTMNELLGIVPAARTFPQILLYGELVGGYTDLVEYFKENE